MTYDPYLDRTTGILINKLGITEDGPLRRAAADISAARLDEIAARPIAGGYDLPHLQRFHRKIYGDIFPWAGELRTIPIFKDTGFCLPQHIVSYADSEFSKLRAEDHLRGLGVAAFVDRLAYYHAEINEIHPFREGNGRALRAFLRQLAREADYRLDWTVVNPEDNHAAALAAHGGDLEPLQALLTRVVRPL